MSNEKVVNGIYGLLEARDALMLKFIAEKYELDQDELTDFVKTSLATDKSIKTVKLLARRPKAGGDKKKKNVSGYGKFSEANRPKIIEMLKDTPAERKFKNRKGETIIVDEADFQKGEPTFTHITQKCGALWAALSDKEKNVFNEKAKEENEARVSQSSTSTTKSKKTAAKAKKPAAKAKKPAAKNAKKPAAKNTKNAKKDDEEEEVEEEAEEEEEVEEEDGEESEKSRKKGSGRKNEKAKSVNKKKGGK